MPRRLRSLTCALALAIAAVVLAPTGPASATDPTDGLRVESSTTYTVDLDAEVIRADVLLRLTNELPDEVSDTVVRSFYFSDFSLPVLPGATNVQASWEGGAPLRVSVEPADGALAAYATIDLAPDLYHGPAKEVRLRYEVPAQPPRSGAAAQVNRAFATLPVFTSADPGLGSVTVVLPAHVDVEIAGADMTRRTGEGVVSYTAEAVADPADWFATVIARDDDALVSSLVFFQDIGVRVQAWPHDTEWLAFVGDLVERGLPALRSTIGRPWGVHGQLDVVETSAPYVYGYGGWYEHDSALIEVGDDLDAHVVLHEMAHAWFNGEAFDSRWINEALADEFAALAMVELGMERPLPEPVDPAAPGAVRLNAWTTPNVQDAPAEQEAYGYAAVAWIAHALVEEVGAAALSDAVNAAMDRTSPYPAATDPGQLDHRADWRAFLDHLEDVAGSRQAADLFRTYVVTEEQAPLLDARTAAREAYAALLAAGDGWAPPAAVRDAMTDWDFDAARAMAPRVREVFAARDAIADTLTAAGVAVPTALQQQVERATDVDALERAMAQAGAAATALADAVAAHADANPMARIGMLVVPAQRDLDRAREAFAAGDWQAAERAADAAAGGVGTATYAGGGALGLVVLAAAAGVLARRRSGGDPGSGPTGGEPAAWSPDDATPPRDPEPDAVLHR